MKFERCTEKGSFFKTLSVSPMNPDINILCYVSGVKRLQMQSRNSYNTSNGTFQMELLRHGLNKFRFA